MEDSIAALESKAAALEKFDASLVGAAEADALSFVAPFDDACEQLVRLHAERWVILSPTHSLTHSPFYVSSCQRCHRRRAVLPRELRG